MGYLSTTIGAAEMGGKRMDYMQAECTNGRGDEKVSRYQSNKAKKRAHPEDRLHGITEIVTAKTRCERQCLTLDDGGDGY